MSAYLWMNEEPVMIDLGHTKIPHWTIGAGPDLVFVHGWPLDGRTWRWCVEELQDRFTCHVIDLPGAGRSEWSDDTPLGIDGYVGVLCATMAQMNLGERFGLIGHDSGGTFARHAAAAMPDRIAGMVLGNTEIPGHHPWRLDAALAAMKIPGAKAMLKQGLGHPKARRKMFRDAIFDLELVESQLAPLFVEPLLGSERVLDGALLLARKLATADFDAVREAHPKITAPVRLVWGEQDPWFPLTECRGMLDQFGGEVELVVVPDAKLFVHEDHPQRFAREVGEHFDRIFDLGSARITMA